MHAALAMDLIGAVPHYMVRVPLPPRDNSGVVRADVAVSVLAGVRCMPVHLSTWGKAPADPPELQVAGLNGFSRWVL